VFFIGLDLGKRLDYSAIAVVERWEKVARGFDYFAWRHTEDRTRGLQVRYLERIHLGTPYTEVVRRVGEVVERLRERGKCRLVVDATGVGMPVVDMLRSANLGCELTPLLITSGAEQHYGDGVWHVPKLDLLAGVQAALESGDLRLVRQMKERATLVQELVDVRVRARESGRVRVGADGYGQHDDLVIAVALAVWAGRKRSVGEKDEPLRV
jgi:hypothetical protein